MSSRIYRADIDGLRAIAVAAVVLYHALPGSLPSGFVGVDIFFVISGYLIGGIIYSEALGEKFKFADFYARRAKRILPALIVVVLATLVAGLFLLESSRLRELSSQSIAALVGLSNLYFWENTNYFDTASELQPLLMTWSLGVEEQFYVIFPFFVIALLRVPAKFRVAVMVAITVGSFLLMLLFHAEHPVSSFYLLPARAWELSVGATLAIASRELQHKSLSPLAVNFMASAGLVLILLSIIAFDHSSAFPFLPIFVSVVGTAMLIHTSESWINKNLLSFRAFVFVGLISYSWYLWHWPIMAYMRIVSDGAVLQSALIFAVFLSFALAILSWRYVERPFRTKSISPKRTLLVTAGAMLTILTIPVAVRLSDGLPQRLAPAVLVAEKARIEGRGTCLQDYSKANLSEAERCNPVGAKIALIGDSHASALGPGLEAFAASRGTTLMQHTKSSCAPFLGFSYSSFNVPIIMQTCGPFVSNAVDRMTRDPEIGTIVVAAYWPLNDQRVAREFSNGTLGDAVPMNISLEQGIQALITAADQAGKRVIIVEDVPNFDIDTMSYAIGDGLPFRSALRSIVAKSRKVGDSESERIQSQTVTLDSENTLKGLANKNENTFYFPIREQLCDDLACRYVQNGRPIYFDRHHLSAFGSRTIDWNAAFPSPEADETSDDLTPLQVQ